MNHPLSSTTIPFLPVTLLRLLPGPTRKRGDSLYAFLLTYRNPAPQGPCCLMTWEVVGGRMTYQIALEQDEWGERHFHCTCADAVFRAEPQGLCCKHVRGLLEFCDQELLPRPPHGVAAVPPEIGRN